MKLSSLISRPASALAAALAVGLVCGGASAAETQATGHVKTIDVRPQNRSSNPVAPTATDLELSKKSDGCPTLPDGITATYYSSSKFDGKTIWFVLGKSAKDGSSLDKLAVDLNGDGSFGKDEVKDLKVHSGMARGQAYAQGTLLGSSFPTKGGDYSFAFQYTAYPVSATPHARLISLSYLEAPVTVDGNKYVVDVSDGNVNGAFNDQDDSWTIHSAGTTSFRAMSSSSQTGLGDGHFFDGHRFVVSVGKDGSVHVSASKASGPDKRDLEAIRERVEKKWDGRFDKERDQFVKQMQVDTSRPMAKTPIQWNYVTFDQALAMAKKENKPLFVDVMAFWCVWCYRMDYYTYPDAEVAKILNNDFIPVKVIQEQDRSDYGALMQKMGANGIPAMGVWDATGNLDDTLNGWKKPSDFVDALKSALKKVASAASGKKGTGSTGGD